MSQRLGITRDPNRKVFAYRTLSKSDLALWPLVGRIKTYAVLERSLATDSVATAADSKKAPKDAIPDDNFNGVRGYYYSMSGHAEKCVERYLDLAKMTL